MRVSISMLALERAHTHTHIQRAHSISSGLLPKMNRLDWLSLHTIKLTAEVFVFVISHTLFLAHNSPLSVPLYIPAKLTLAFATS